MENVKKDTEIAENFSGILLTKVRFRTIIDDVFA